MSAGASAENIAARARATSERAAERSLQAARQAERYEAGHDGERRVAQVLAPLTVEGWYLLNDRESPGGGNVDHLVIGPPGVYVVDAKNWSYPARVSGDRISTGKYRRDREVDKVLEIVARVVGAVANAPGLFVRGVLALAGADSDRSAAMVRGVTVVGIEHLRPALSGAPRRCSPMEVERVMRELSVAFPPAVTGTSETSAVTVDSPIETRPLFDRTNRFYYLREWRKTGSHRLYLRDSTGQELGWKDVLSNATHVDSSANEPSMVEAVLRAASPIGVKLSSSELPKVPVALAGTKLLARIAGLYANVLIGQEWRGYGKHRLFGTFVVKTDGTFPLGYVDLRDGSLHPSVDGSIGKDLSPARNYLQLLRDRMPAEEPRRAKASRRQPG